MNGENGFVFETGNLDSLVKNMRMALNQEKIEEIRTNIEEKFNISAYKMESHTTYYSIVFEVYGFLAFAASIGLSTIIKPFMNIYVGQSFTMAWCYVPLLLVAASFSAISSFFGSMLGAIQISKYTMYSTLVGGFFNVLLNYIFIQKKKTKNWKEALRKRE